MGELNLISLGIYDEKDMSFRAFATAKKCDILYWENYTSTLNTTVEKLANFIHKPIKIAHRSDLEEDARKILQEAKIKKVGIFIGGSCFAATTHISLLVEAKKMNIKVNVIEGSSIFTAIGITSLSLYKFGKTASIPEWKDNFKPESFVDIYEQNKKIHAHTLFLLDIGLSPVKAIKQLLQAAKKRKLNLENTKALVCINLGTPKYKIIYKELSKINNSESPSCLIIPSKLHFTEEDYVRNFS